MPNTKSAIKAAKQNIKRRVTNLKALDIIHKTAKNFKKLTAAGDSKEAQKALSAAFAALDKAAKKNIIHKNTANRKKSRLARMIKAK